MTKRKGIYLHVGVADAHAAKDGESFDEILVVFGKG